MQSHVLLLIVLRTSARPLQVGPFYWKNNPHSVGSVSPISRPARTTLPGVIRWGVQRAGPFYPLVREATFAKLKNNNYVTTLELAQYVFGKITC